MEPNQNMPTNPTVASGVEVPPVLIGGVAEDQFFAALSEFTGNQVTSRDQWSGFQQRATDYDVLQARIQELEGKNAYASPLVEKINQMVQKGEPAERLAQYVNLSGRDLNSLSAEQALRLEYQFNPAGFSQDQIDAMLEEKYGLAPGVDPSSLSPASQAKLQEARYAAIQSLQSLKADYDPKPVVPDPAAEMARQTAITRWAGEIPRFTDTIPFKMPGDKAKNIMGYEFDYKAPPEIVNSVKSAVMQEVQRNPQQYPANEQGEAAVRGLYDLLLTQATNKDRMEKMVLDMQASLLVAMKAAQTGQMPGIPGLPAAQTPPATRATNGRYPPPLTEEQIRRMNS